VDKCIVKLFWRLVKKGAPNECWPWLGALDSRGRYGVFLDSEQQREIVASRFVLQLILGRRLVPNVERHIFACHTCDNPPCCNPKHIFAGDNLANQRDSVAKNRHVSQHHKNGAVLTEEEILEIRGRYSRGEFGIDLASEFGVSRAAIHTIVSGKTWRDEGGPITKLAYKGNRGGLPKHTVLTAEQAKTIYQRCYVGERPSDLAREYGVSRATVSDIYKKRSWKRLWV
jgi:hypothetical protein